MVSVFSVTSPYKSQPLRLYITATGKDNDITATASQLVLKVNGYQVLELPVEVKAGQRIYSDGKKFYLCDPSWMKIKEIPVSRIPIIETGQNDIQVEADFSSDTAPKLDLAFKFMDEPERVGK